MWKLLFELGNQTGPQWVNNGKLQNFGKISVGRGKKQQRSN